MNNIRLKTVKLLGRLMQPLTEEGVISVPEMNQILSNLKSLANKGELLPPIQPRLIDQREASEMLGISLANFKKLEKEGAFSFQRRPLGAAVRYRLGDLITFIMSNDTDINAETATTAN